jgi:phage terminase large subunit-like protein
MTPELTDGPRLRAFSRRYIRHTKGRWAGQPLIYERWQDDFWDEALEVDGITGLRVYQEVLLGIPRKNGKSTMAGAGGLYFLTSDGENEPEVYIAAAALRQAGVVFRQEKRFVEASPGLQDFVIARQHHIDCPQNGGILRVLSSDAALQHGLNPHCNIIDELHAHKNGELYTALTSGGGAREQPITLTITTSGVNEEQVLGQIYNAALEKAGLIERPSPYLTIVRDRESGFLMFWFGAPPDADPMDPAVWAGANPSSWITERYLRRELTKPSMRLTDFRRWHLNQWVTGVEDWLPVGTWAACREGKPDPDDWLHGLDPKRPVAVAIDFGASDDTTCISVSQRVPMPIGRRSPEMPGPTDLVVTRAKFFVPDPELGIDANVHAILDELRALRIRFPAAARKVDRRHAAGPVYAYDPWGFKALAVVLEGEGLVMVEVPQNDTRMVPAATELYGLVIARRLRHDNNPMLARHIANVVGRSRGEAGWRITKLKDSSKKIDGAVATAMSVHEALQPWPGQRVGAFVA